MRGCSCRGTAGFVHVSCLVEQAKILFEEAEDNHLGDKVMNERFSRWYSCSLCEQDHHGVVRCALGWACWKTHVGRREADQVRIMAMSVVGLGLHEVGHDEDAVSVRETELAMLRRIGAPATNILIAQGNLATTYRALGRFEEALSLRRDVYSGKLRLYGEENEETLRATLNYADSLTSLEHFEEAKTLLLKAMPVARQVLGENHEDTLRLRWVYAEALYEDDSATLDDLREAVTTLEDAGRIARRVLGGAHPIAVDIEGDLRNARYAIRARGGDVEAMTPGDA